MRIAEIRALPVGWQIVESRHTSHHHERGHGEQTASSDGCDERVIEWSVNRDMREGINARVGGQLHGRGYRACYELNG